MSTPAPTKFTVLLGKRTFTGSYVATDRGETRVEIIHVGGTFHRVSLLGGMRPNSLPVKPMILFFHSLDSKKRETTRPLAFPRSVYGDVDNHSEHAYRVQMWIDSFAVYFDILDAHPGYELAYALGYLSQTREHVCDPDIDMDVMYARVTAFHACIDIRDDWYKPGLVAGFRPIYF